MRHRGLEIIPPSLLADAVARTPLDHFVIWTGHAAQRQDGSLRSRALACLHEPRRPVALRELLLRAARAGGETGFQPEVVRSAVRLHQAARPACYLLVRRRPTEEYVAVTRIPWPAGCPRPVQEGELVADRHGFLLSALRGPPREPADDAA